MKTNNPHVKELHKAHREDNQMMINYCESMNRKYIKGVLDDVKF